MSTTENMRALTDAVNESFEPRQHPSPDNANHDRERPLKYRLVERGTWDKEFTGVSPWVGQGAL